MLDKSSVFGKDWTICSLTNLSAGGTKFCWFGRNKLDSFDWQRLGQLSVLCLFLHRTNLVLGIIIIIIILIISIFTIIHINPV